MSNARAIDRIHHALSSYRQQCNAEPRQMRLSEATIRQAVEEVGFDVEPNNLQTMFGVPVKLDDKVGDEIVLVFDTP